MGPDAAPARRGFFLTTFLGDGFLFVERVGRFIVGAGLFAADTRFPAAFFAEVFLTEAFFAVEPGLAAAFFADAFFEDAFFEDAFFVGAFRAVAFFVNVFFEVVFFEVFPGDVFFDAISPVAPRPAYPEGVPRQPDP